MSSIKSFIEGYMTGNAWEDLCVQCYRIRYQKDNYTAIPATQGGDAGIEGFTYKGVVHQCYCPERNYSDNDLYDHQRDKLTADIEKLKKNADRLKALGVPPVVEWDFNIPEYKDTRILKHAESKRQEVIKAKKDKPSDYAHIADDFQIVIKTAEDFTPEISRVIRTSLSDMRLNLAIEHSSEPNWSKCDSEKVANIRRKIKAIMLVDDADEALNKVVGIYVDCYISGLEILNNLRVHFPEIYEEIYRLEQSYKREVSIKTLMNTDKTMNRTLFDAILNEFHSKLERDFSSRFTEASIGELKQDINFETKEVYLFGKGEKHRTSYLNAKAEVAVKEYLATREDSNMALIVSDRKPNDRMHKAGIERIIKEIESRITDLTTHITPHVFRHTTATVALSRGMDISDVSRLLGHSKVDTTMEYITRSNESIHEKHKNCII